MSLRYRVRELEHRFDLLEQTTICKRCSALVVRPEFALDGAVDHDEWHEKNRAALAAALVRPRKPAATKAAKAAKPVPRKGGK